MQLFSMDNIFKSWVYVQPYYNGVYGVAAATFQFSVRHAHCLYSTPDGTFYITHQYQINECHVCGASVRGHGHNGL